MSIIEVVKLQERRQGRLEGERNTEEKKNYEFVSNLISEFGFSDEQAARASNTSIDFVMKVRVGLVKTKK